MFFFAEAIDETLGHFLDTLNREDFLQSKNCLKQFTETPDEVDGQTIDNSNGKKKSSGIDLSPHYFDIIHQIESWDVQMKLFENQPASFFLKEDTKNEITLHYLAGKTQSKELLQLLINKSDDKTKGEFVKKNM